MAAESYAESQLIDLARALTARAGAGEVFGLQRIEGGRNNRAYRVETRDRAFFLKVYRADGADPRPRRQTEFAFLDFAWAQGVRAVPEPIAVDSDNNLSLHAFVAGRRLGRGEVTRAHIEQAGRFISELNRNRETAAAAALPVASEACFSVQQHLELIDQRVQRLQTIERGTAVGAEAAALVSEQLIPTWQQVSQRCRQDAAEAGILDAPELPQRDRCLSPSDFGFHNAIAGDSGQLTFHDFEYAGWDDPAKLACDFLCQPEVPIAEADASFAIERLLAGFENSEVHRRRVELLRPLYVVKWGCICLNDFLPAAQHRSFAGTHADREQIAKVQSFLERLRSM